MRHLPWGPELSSASGAPKRALPRNEDERFAHATVRLPRHVGGALRVWVGGRPQAEGEDFFIVGRLLVFAHDLEPEGPRGPWWRLLMSSGAGARRRRRGRVDVWFETEDDAGVVRDLDVKTVR